MPIAQALCEQLSPYCAKIQIAGSLRREKPDVGDIEIVAMNKGGLLEALDKMVSTGEAEIAIYSNGKARWGSSYRGLLYKGMKCEIFLANEWNWGYILMLRTGPGDANQYLMQFLNYRHSPYKAEGGFWWKGETKLAIQSEQALYTMLGMKYLEPSNRTEDAYRLQLQGAYHRFGPAPLMCVVYFDHIALSDADQVDCTINTKDEIGHLLAMEGWMTAVGVKDWDKKYLELLRTRWLMNPNVFMRAITRQRLVLRMGVQGADILLDVLRKVGLSRGIAVVFGGVLEAKPTQTAMF